MLEYDFLKLLNPYVKQYENFPLPVALTDRELTVMWSNRSCKLAIPVVSECGGLSALLAEYSKEELFEALEQQGSYTIAELVPLSELSVSFLPVLDADQVAGAVVLFFNLQVRLDSNTMYHVAKSAQGFSANIRGCIDDIFATMDTASIKADLLHDGWIKQSFTRIGLSGYRILRVAENISLFARLRSGSQTLRLQTYDMVDWLGPLAEAFSEFGRSIGVEIELSLPDEPCPVAIDQSTMEAAFFNLLHNSLFFTRPGNQVRIALERSEKNVVLTITDQGLGIPAYILPQIWKAYTVYTHEQRGAGLGLGLAIVKMVCDLHDVEIQIDSVYGEGTAVVLKLPLAKPGYPVRLRQGEEGMRLNDRFSSFYIGLADAAASPFRSEE